MTRTEHQTAASADAWTPDVVIVAGGPVVSAAADAPTPPAPLLAAARLVPTIAADGGLALARAMGLAVEHVVGDLDSVDAADLGWAEQRAAVVHRHHPDKDATDLELALDLAAEVVDRARGSLRLLVLGADGGRLDHVLGDLQLLAGARTSAWSVRAHFGPAAIDVVRVHDPGLLRGRPRQHVSLFALVGPVLGVTTSGLRWPLAGADLDPADGALRSNEIVHDEASVSVRGGTLLVVRPGTVADPFPDRDLS